MCRHCAMKCILDLRNVIVLLCCCALFAINGKAAERCAEMPPQARWISGETVSPESPAPVLERRFDLAEIPRKAELVLAVAGWVEVSVNGQRVGRDVLSPVTCQPDARLAFITMDVTDYLKTGENVLEVLLGNGWFNCFTKEVWGFSTAKWLASPMIRGRLDVEGKTLVVTDGKWIAYDSPIVFNALRNGEWYDARKEGLRENERPVAVVAPSSEVKVSTEDAVPCREFDPIDPVRSIGALNGGTIYDFGSNRTGWCDIEVEGERGAKVIIDYDECITQTNTLLGGIAVFIKRANDPRPMQHDEYTLAGRKGGERWHPRFTYHGFRYAQVRTIGKVEIKSIRSVFVHSDFKSIGKIDISDPVFAKLQDAARRSYLSNFTGIPTDCPHREKNGWTGDAQLAMETGLWNFDAKDGYVHFLRMMLDAQKPNGQVPCILPCTEKFGYGWGSGPAWDAALFEIPWQIYRFYGDDAPAKEAYTAMKKYLGFISTKARSDGLIAHGLGDWCAPKGLETAPVLLTDSAYIYEFNRRTAFWAEHLGEKKVARIYHEQADRIKVAFNKEFYKGSGIYADGQLTALAAPLYFKGLCADGEEKKVAAELLRRVREDGHRAHFGILGAKWVPRVLSEYGCIDDAWRIFTQSEAPGWARWMENNDTLLESFDDDAGGIGVSHNHVMFGDFSAWAFEYLAGIKNSSPGFAEVEVKPHLPTGVDSFEIMFKAPTGPICVKASRKSGKPVYEVANDAKTALDYVDPLIGTEGVGTQYGGMQPYTCVPFGSFHLVPMTRTNRIGRLSFNSSDENLLGFILTRQPAIWMGDWGEVRVEVPSEKILEINATPYHTEITTVGGAYELAATAHSALIRGLDQSIIDSFPQSGVNTNRMDAQYGYPLPNFGGRWFVDKTHQGELRIGVSLISVEQAKMNLEREVGARTFEEVAAGAKQEWEEMFARLEIDAPDDIKTIFYTGLYHALLYPRKIDEYGRYYSAFDDRMHDGEMYTCFSLWDTYRAEHPLLALVAPERVDGMMQSLIDMQRQGGWLPLWPNPSYTGIMCGAPAEVVLAEAYVKGFRGFDIGQAYAAVRKNAMCPQRFDDECKWIDRGMFGRFPETRGGLHSYMVRGYVSCDLTAESVSRTQDFGLADRAAAILSDAVGRSDEAEMFRARSCNYTNNWCSEDARFLPRKSNGDFVRREFLAKPYHDYCEQSPETAIWAVPYDTEGLSRLLGGKEESVRKLDEYFDTLFWLPERGNRSIHGNQPSHHTAYLYNRFGNPRKTQQRVREILTRAYSTNRKGFDGNEDCGQMSAWYILSSLGFYPIDTISGEYEIGTPLVKHAKLTIGKPFRPVVFEIKVKNYSEDRWKVKRVVFNGKKLADFRLRHSDILAGGVLEFEME